MKLKQYINENHKGNASEYARVNGYHLTQVRRFLAKDAEYNNGEPYYIVTLNKASTGRTT